MEHPEPQELKAYLARTDAAEFAQLRMHLALCQDCRTELAILDQAAELTNQDELVDSAEQEQLIANYVLGNLDKSEASEVAAMLQNDPRALKAALHFATHHAEMAPGLDHLKNHSKQATQPDVVSSQQTDSLYSRFRQWFQWRTPVWVAVPASLVMAGLFSVGLVNMGLVPQLASGQKQFVVATYQDNPVIRFQLKQQQPGIGFFANAGQLSKPFSRLDVQLLNNHKLILSWPAVEKAAGYQLQLHLMQNGKRIIIEQVKTRQTSAEVNRAAEDSGQRYAWQLSGETTDGKLFTVEGGFVIHLSK